MKKIMFLLCCLLVSFSVSAKGVVNYIPVLPRCVSSYNDKIVIPVNIVSSNEGTISNLIKEYNIGRIYNDDKVVKVKIMNVKGKNIDSIYIDSNRDEDRNSDIKFVTSNSFEIKKLETMLSFDIVYEFYDIEKTNDIYVFGNSIKISEKDVCEVINKNDVLVLDDSYIIENYSNNQVSEKKNNKLLYISIGINIFLIVFMFIKKIFR